MKNFTFLFFLALMAVKGYGQCIRTFNSGTTASNNSGFAQQLSACAWTTNDVVTVTNLLVGKNYTFTCSIGSIQNYITVTDANNVTIEEGPSPLTLSAVSASTVKLHLSDDASCAGSMGCHIVTVQVELDCPTPTGLEMYELGTTSAIFVWEPVGSETSWEVIALPVTSSAPAVDLTEGVSVVNDNPEFTAALSSATTYKFYYRAVCSDTEKSPWNSSEAFTTLCEEVAHFSEGFDAGNSLPTCYSKVGSQGSVYVQSESTSPSLPNILYMESGGILSLPSVSNYSEETHRIKFKLRSIYTVGGSVEFGYFFDPSNAASFVALETFTTNSLTVYDEYTFAPDAGTQTGYFAFRHIAAGNNSVILDDIVWEPIPACPDVTLLKTDAYTSTTAALSWTSQETSWEVVYGVAATTANPSGLTPFAVEEASVALSNLESNTAYKVWVRSVCGEDVYGAWIGPKTVTTTCAPVTTFSENFDASITIPACLKKVGNGGNVYVQSSSTATSLPNVLAISSYQGSSGMSYGILSLPPVSNAVAGTHRLKFNARSSGNVGGVLEIGYMQNSGDAASFVSVQTFTSNSSSAFETFVYIPAAGAIEAEVLAIRHSGNTSNTIHIDNIIWEAAPACGDVTAIQAKDISNASAKVLWTGNSETNWEVAYGATTVTDPNTLTPVAVSDVATTVLTDLDAATTYKVWVRSNCGTAGYGAWIGPLQFSTACDPITSFSENFNAAMTMPSCWTQFGGFVMTSFPSQDDNFVYMTSLAVLAAPQVSNAAAGTHRLRFKAKSMYNLGGTVEVGYMTSYNTVATFVPLQSYTPTSTTVFDEFYANLGTLPTTGYLAIRHSGVSSNAVAIDDVVWEPLPSCEEVDNLIVSGFTNNTATLVWEATYSTAWEIVYTEVSDNTLPSDLTPSFSEEQTFTFSELDPDTVYKGWVRSVCDNQLYSAWVGPLEFKTTCDPIADLPWAEDFESMTLPDFAACWTKENGNWMAVDHTQQMNNPSNYTIPNSGSKYIRCYNGAVNSHMWTPGFELMAGNSYDFSTFVQGDGYDGWSVAMVYNTLPRAEGAVQFGEIFEPSTGVIGTVQYEEMRNAFVPTVSGTYFFAVKVNENSTSNPFYIAFDDFSLEEGTLGNPVFGANAFIAYPNPVKDVLHLSYTENITDVAVFNLLGQQVIAKTINANKGQVDLSGLSTGSYLVKLTAGNQVKTIKIIKE